MELGGSLAVDIGLCGWTRLQLSPAARRRRAGLTLRLKHEAKPRRLEYKPNLPSFLRSCLLVVMITAQPLHQYRSTFFRSLCGSISPGGQRSNSGLLFSLKSGVQNGAVIVKQLVQVEAFLFYFKLPAFPIHEDGRRQQTVQIPTRLLPKGVEAHFLDGQTVL